MQERKPRSTRHPLAMGILAACLLHAGDTLASTADLDWDTCERSNPYIGEEHPGTSVLCASLRVPLDYRNPTGKTTEVQVMRVRHGHIDTPRKAIFFNFGGPGHDPRETLERTAVNWVDVAPDDEVFGEFNKVAGQFDLITLVPRGMNPDNRLECDYDRELPLHELYENRDSNRAWRGLLELTRNYARNCGPASQALGVDTDTYVKDIESLRMASGYDKLSFYGASYGSLTALWYGASYPDRVSHMVLDGVMDVTRTWNDIVKTDLARRDQALIDAAVQPAANDAQAYGLGMQAGSVLVKLMRMPLSLRMAWQADIETPEDVLAAVTLSNWLTNGMTLRQVRAALDTHDFSKDTQVNHATIVAAAHLYAAIPRPPMLHRTSNDESDISTGTNLAVQCNDAPWERNIDTWRRFLLNSIGWSFSLGEGDIVTSLVCAQWPRTQNRFPDVSKLAKLPPALILNGEYDRTTTWEGARATMALMPRARAVLARDTSDHGLLGKSLSPCIERTAARYLLTGALPASAVTKCHYEPMPDKR